MRKLTKIFTIFIFLIVNVPLLLQAQSDSVLLSRKKDFYRKGANAYISDKIDSSLYYFKQELRCAQAISDSSGIMNAQNHVSMSYWLLGEKRKAALLYGKVYEMASKLKDTSAMAIALQDLGKYEVSRQDYTIAIQRYEEAYRLSQKMGNDLILMFNLESIYSLYLLDLYNLPKAFRTIEQMKSVLEKLQGEDVIPGNILYCRCLMNYHDKAGQYLDALKYNSRLLDLFATAMKDSPMTYVTEYQRRVMLLQKTIDKEWTYSACDTLSMLAKTIDSDKAQADISYMIATSYLKYKDYALAEAEFEKTYRITSRLGNKFLCAAVLKYMADIHYARKDYPAAREAIDKAITLCPKGYTSLRLSLLATRSLYYLKEKDMDSVWKDCHELIISEKQIIKNNIRKLTEQEREKYWETAGTRIFGYAAMGAKSSAWNNEFTGDVYDALLFSKGLLLHSGEHVHTMVARSADDSVKTKYSQYLSLLSQLDAIHASSHMSMVADSIRWRADDLYREVIDAVDYYGGFTAFLDVDWRQVQKSLGSEDAAVEFMDYQVDSTVQYAAAVIRKGWEYPRLVPLCSAADLEPIISLKEGYEFYSQKNVDELYRLILSSLSSYLSTDGMVFFSPSGVLHKINLEALAQGQYRFKRLSSTRELCITKAAKPFTSAVLFGGLQYEEWESLPGTRKEVERVENIISKAIPEKDIDLYQGLKGSRECFLSLSGNPSDILHISTHGFFMERDTSHTNYFAEAMRRSGLALSGGNILGSEIANMDLKGTSLVVLSACETGLGDVSSEGVFGLQRAFKKAGVKTVIMSLWKVSDKATFQLMSQFYTNLIIKKQDKDLAFTNAIKSVRRKFEEPYYWAGFVMLD